MPRRSHSRVAYEDGSGAAVREHTYRNLFGSEGYMALCCAVLCCAVCSVQVLCCSIG